MWLLNVTFLRLFVHAHALHLVLHLGPQFYRGCLDIEAHDLRVLMLITSRHLIFIREKKHWWFLKFTLVILFHLKIITEVNELWAQANGVLYLSFYLRIISDNIVNKDSKSCLKRNLLLRQNIFLKLNHIYDTKHVSNSGVFYDYSRLLREFSRAHYYWFMRFAFKVSHMRGLHI